MAQPDPHEFHITRLFAKVPEEQFMDFKIKYLGMSQPNYCAHLFTFNHRNAPGYCEASLLRKVQCPPMGFCAG